MTDLISLWLPILLSAVVVFIVSSIIHMLMPWHKNDYAQIPNEDKIMDALRPFNIPPGDYMMPRASSWVLMGGYTLVSEPVTLWPKAFAMAAMPPIKLPQIPKICTCIANSHFLLH